MLPLPTECRISGFQLKNNNVVKKMDFVTWRKVAVGVAVWRKASSEALILLGYWSYRMMMMIVMIIIIIIIIFFLFYSSFKSRRCIIHAGNSITVFVRLAFLFVISIVGNYPINWSYQ